MAYFTVDRELVDPDFHDGVVRSFMDDLPLQTVIGRIKAPIDITQDVEVEALPSVYDPAIAEGQEYDKTGAIKKLNPVMTEVIEQFRSKGWRVSRLRQKLPGHNEKKGQTAANKRAADARDLAINIEHSIFVFNLVYCNIHSELRLRIILCCCRSLKNNIWNRLRQMVLNVLLSCGKRDLLDNKGCPFLL